MAAELGRFTFTRLRVTTDAGYEFEMPLVTQDFSFVDVGDTALINLQVDVHEIQRFLNWAYPEPPEFHDPAEADDWLDRHPRAT